MTPDNVIEYARQRYNAVGDTGFSPSMMYRLVWDAQMILARETWCIRSVKQTTTVADQQEYSFPTSTLAVKHVTYDGDTVEPRSLEEVLRLTSSSASPTGSPCIYALWNNVFYLAPIPSAAQTLKIWSIDEPGEVSSTSTLEVPSRYHLNIAEYLNWQMALFDKNYEGAAAHQANWQAAVMKAKADERKLLRGQKFSFVKDEDSSLQLFGVAP